MSDRHEAGVLRRWMWVSACRTRLSMSDVRLVNWWIVWKVCAWARGLHRAGDVIPLAIPTTPGSSGAGRVWL